MLKVVVNALRDGGEEEKDVYIFGGRGSRY